jgi:hypothetical protein
MHSGSEGRVDVAAIAYLLCAATSAGCAVLLLRGYLRTKTRLLLWSTLCFVGLALDNSLLFADRVLFPGEELFALRRLLSLIGAGILLFGLIWDAD